MRIRRDRSFRLPLTSAELEMLHAIAEANGLSASEYVRWHVRNEYAARFGRDGTAKRAKKGAPRQ